MIYDFLLALYFFPKYFYERIFFKKKRSFLLERMGLKSPPPLPEGGGPVIWIHAVSVGETKAAQPLFRRLKKEHPKARFIISSVTETGHEEAKRSLSEANLFLFLPFDFSFAVRKTLRNYPIDLLLFVESDLWYNFCRVAKQHKARIALISGKMSEKSARRYCLFSFYGKKLFSYFDKICVQNEIFKERYLSAHVPEEKIEITGNLKFDSIPTFPSEEEKEQWRPLFFSSSEDSFITIASTHASEEEKILEALSNFLSSLHHKVFLAPRHPERFSQIEKLLSQKGFSFTKLSHFQQGKQIILIDRLGFLPICYSFSQLAIVGGSFIDHIGGHNILEPIHFGVPVIFGPFMAQQQELVQHVLQQKCGCQVSLPGLSRWVSDYFTQNSLREEWLKKCSLFGKNNHSTNRSYLAIRELL